jgi:hypothetical protein
MRATLVDIRKSYHTLPLVTIAYRVVEAPLFFAACSG